MSPTLKETIAKVTAPRGSQALNADLEAELRHFLSQKFSVAMIIAEDTAPQAVSILQILFEQLTRSPK